MTTTVERRAPSARPSRARKTSAGPLSGRLGALVLVGCAAIGAVQLYRPSPTMPVVPFAHLQAALAAEAPPNAVATPDAFGRSGELKVRFALPGEGVEFPLAISGPTDSLTYEWVSVTDSAARGPRRSLTSARPIVPTAPGFYHLAILHGEARQIVREPTVAVLVPFERKLGQWLNGYLIGNYLAERLGGRRHDTPQGFVEVQPGMEGIALSTHLTLGDFITHDAQRDVWPKYVAIDPLLLDKLELVLVAVGGRGNARMSVDVHSGFRAPAYNATVQRSARDSRHQYGDAADIQIDANGDGVIDMTDELLVMLAVDRVEYAHPELVGGLGVYSSRRYRTPYLHIDTRGVRARWHG
jgi:uncharacterized protein YcbK (DUF882 family)